MKVTLTGVCFYLFCTVNFSYPSLEEPKPPTPPPPEPEVVPEPAAPALVNGVAPAEPPTSKTSTLAGYRLPDAVDAPVTTSTNSGPDLSKKSGATGAAASSQSPGATRTFPQVQQVPTEERKPSCSMFVQFSAHRVVKRRKM